jgi:hypothetical protein
VVASAPSVNSRIAAFLLALLFCPSCATPSLEDRAAARAAIRYLAALSAHDARALHDRGTCDLPSGAILGANLLRVEPIRFVERETLDSLASAAAQGERRAAGDQSRATERDADSLWLRWRLLARRASLYSNAVRAASRSAGSTASRPVSTRWIVCRAHVRIRWGGPLVGPEPVDREHLLRILAAPGGAWIVFSLFQVEDDPVPGPI